MIKNGSYIDDHYEYKIDNKIFKYYDGLDDLILERIDKNEIFTELWTYKTNKDLLFYNCNFYDKLCSGKILLNDELYNRFNNYLNKYILGKSN